MQKSRLFLILFFNFLLISSLVFAVQITPQTLSNSLCPRETGLFSHVIKNDNAVPREYTINLRGNAAQWATSVPRGFILASNEEKTVFTYVTPMQSANPGNYNLEIEANSPGDSKTVIHTVNIKNCYGTTLTTNQNIIETCPNEAVKYTISITNSGEYQETFHLQITGEIAQKVTLSDNTLVLNRGESKNIIIFANSPSDSREYSFSLIAESENEKIRESLPLYLKVKPCYDFLFSIQGNNTYNICERTYINIPLNLKNDGTTTNSFKASLEGPTWARLEKTDFLLREKEARSFNLAFAPNYGSAGEYAIRLTVNPERGNVKTISDFNVNVRKCTSVKVEFLEEEAESCKGAANSYQALVTNNGEIKKVFKLQLDSPNWVSISQENSMFTLEPGQQKNITINATPTSEIKQQNYIIKLKAQTTDESAVSANDEAELTLEVKNVNECYKPKVKTAYNDVIVYYDSSVTLPIEISNDGTRKAEFSLLLTGNAAAFSTLNPSVLSLDPGKSEMIYLYIAPNVNIKPGEYNDLLTINAKNGPLLATKEISIEITDVVAKATKITPIGVNTTIESTSLWQRFKSWFFKGNDTIQTNNTFNNSTSSITPKSNIKYKIVTLMFILIIIVLAILVYMKISKKKEKTSKKKVTREIQEIKKSVEDE